MNTLIHPGQTLWWACAIPLAVSVVLAVTYAPWKALWRVGERFRLWCAWIGFCGVFWLLNVNIVDVIAFHPLVVMAAVILFGWELGVLSGLLALALNFWIRQQGWETFVIDGWLSVVVPSLASIGVLRLIANIPKKNIFVFILGGGFFGAMVSVLAMLGASFTWFSLTGATSLTVMLSDYAWMLALMLFPEGFINGAIVTMVTVLWPSLVRTYDDAVYLSERPE
ncbi:energy-coupling factor ABC transporter permease [Marinibactrum halimedae]|uniref:Uncharacterized protein n=1 Tax=Marinibactrum halimedae TaxID=1444977 RepID=A0AA37WPJ2_9GAMM|nr:energy-coupling factor ABC transporter permease [Marinibactrum halimedae]MCD9458410.1 energy-coupling factor ABC transporter permease [Marinibactrum halimedae]GLS26107.1 hypothetical protein GCM10007877_18220 [Marinibactrum halimedae]